MAWLVIAGPAAVVVASFVTLALSATATHSLAFAVFWVCCAGACALAVLLERSVDDVKVPGDKAPGNKAPGNDAPSNNAPSDGA